jgi:hypothetical protein
MNSAARRFDPTQDSQSETVSRPITPIAIPSAEQRRPDDRDDQYDEFVFPKELQSNSGNVPLGDTSEAGEVNVVSSGVEAQTAGSDLERTVPLMSIRRSPPRPRPREHFSVLLKWEGTVLSVSDKEFTAVMRDLTDSSLPDEEVTLLVDEVPEADRSLLIPGGVFYWSLGYKVSLSGSRERVSALRFRRLPVWTARDIAAVRRQAETLAKLFG